MLNDVLISKDYKDWLKEIKSRIVVSRINAFQSLNKELIRLYWDIGRSIVGRQAKHKWGQRVVALLSNDLKSEFQNFRGFSPDNLWRMRMFYLEYRDNPKLAQLVPEIPWGHNVLIMQKVKDRKEINFTSQCPLKWAGAETFYSTRLKPVLINSA